MSNRFFWILVSVIIVFFGIFFVTKNKSDAPGSGGTVQATNHVKGEGSSGVTLIEYGDFQCPACGSYYPIVKQLYTDYQDKIKIQFRNFPLTQIHQNAFVASRAAEAAAKQGKFWEMHDLLFENQQSWGQADNPSTFFETYAAQLGLNVEQFKTDMASSEVNDLINADIKEAQAVNAKSTPTFVLDGTKLEANPQSLDEFKKLIDDAIAAKANQ